MKNGVTIVENRIVIDYNGAHLVRFINHIRFCVSCSHCCEVYFDLIKPVVAPIAISKLELLLPKDSFCKIHRQSIIHRNILQYAIIKDEKIYYFTHTLPVSHTKIDELLHILVTFPFSEQTE